MLFVPTHSIVYNSSLHVGGVAFEVTSSDVDALEGYGQVILTDADKADIHAEAAAPTEEQPKAETKGGATNGKRTPRKAKARNR